LPSIATTSGPPTQALKHALNSSGSSTLITSPSVWWLGMPYRYGSKRHRKPQVLLAPELDCNEIVRSRQRRAQQQKDLRQRIQHLRHLPRILQRGKMIQQSLAQLLLHGSPPAREAT
jgi:hypothetical protein